MLSDRHLEGRYEKRLPIMVVVRLADTDHPDSNGEEKTYTDNVSPHGACVASKRPWRPGEEVEVFSIADALTARAKVVYCRQVKSDFYFIGLNFPGQRPIRWSNFTFTVFA
jgi:hypothetical protein